MRILIGMKADEEIRSGYEPDALAWQLIALAEGLRLQWLLDPSSPDMASELRLLIEGVSSEKR